MSFVVFIEKATSKYDVNFQMNEKFHKDSLYQEDEECIIILDGVVLNKQNLCHQNNEMDWFLCLKKMIFASVTGILKELRGSYSVAFYDKKNEKWIFYSDHIGTKSLYYYKDHSVLLISSSFDELKSILNKKSKKLTLSYKAAYLLLTYGYVFEDITIASEIYRLKIGYSLKYFRSNIAIELYYRLDFSYHDIKQHDALQLLDYKFKNAISIAFEKDLEYGYNHICSLSGGLDSRMTAIVAHEMGYDQQLNITFSQSDYLDETIAKQIASDYGHNWMFKSLDNGIFLFDIDEATRITGGNVLYYGLAHANSMYKNMNFRDYGILHTGQLGDVSIATYAKSSLEKRFKIGDGAYSLKLLNRLSDLEFSDYYKNEEQFKMYIRGFYGINMGLKSIQQYTETFSPFYDLDFLEFTMSIPLEMRMHHKLYNKWILNNYPKAANYVWEKTGVRINSPFKIKYKNHLIPLHQMPAKILRKLNILSTQFTSKNSMNPLNYWYLTNPKLKSFMDDYFEKNLDLLPDQDLIKDAKSLYKDSGVTAKNQVLSLLSANKYLNS